MAAKRSRAKVPASLAGLFAAKKGAQADLVRRCKEAGHPVSQAHLSRVAAGDHCSFDLAKTICKLTGLPMSSFGYDLEGVA